MIDFPSTQPALDVYAHAPRYIHSPETYYDPVPYRENPNLRLPLLVMCSFSFFFLVWKLMSNALLKRAELETKGAGTDRRRLKHAPLTEGAGRTLRAGRSPLLSHPR